MGGSAHDHHGGHGSGHEAPGSHADSGHAADHAADHAHAGAHGAGAHDDAGHGHDDAHGHGGHGHDAHGEAGPYPAGFAVIPDLEPAVHHHGHGPDLQACARLGPPRKVVELEGGLAISTIDVGEGEPILFLHGFPTSGALFRGVIERLEGRFRCVAPDLLGFGDTVCPVDGDFGVSAQTDAIEGLLAKLGIDRFAVVGHDWGGLVAQLLAVRHPDRVRQLTLVNAIGFDHVSPPEVRWLARLARLSVAFDLFCETGGAQAFARSRFGMRAGAADPASLSTAFIDHCIAPLFRETPPSYRAPRERFRQALVQFVAEAPSAWHEVSGRLGEFAGPALVVWGCNDPYISVSIAKQLADALPGCTGLELIPRCGHWVPEEAPTRFADLLAAHLAPAGALVPAEAVA